MAKILVIDDDPDIVTAVTMVLESGGHQVSSASSGKQGLERIKADKPELIVLDVMMESHTEGFELAIKLHSPDPASEWRAFRNTPILMLTAIHSTTPLRYEPDIDYLPVELFVDKPIDPDDLLGKVNWILARQKA